ncbi:hypothetical protein FNV43_RR13303 [Rhamnella rubrinervis]|uniref:Uncharacterized protein n=1 Tax=Rhamnella rubrinervis TaxID=2594499 RepID=A0A8K0H0Y4_9ROSA|nr:hypothetical protein FNV43_RR13303 [Rhamnella rubrinervis]
MSFLLQQEELKSGTLLALATPPSWDFRHSIIIEAFRFGPYPSVKNANDDVVRGLAKVLSIVAFPEASLLAKTESERHGRRRARKQKQNLAIGPWGGREGGSQGDIK